ncbi:MAG: SURF1 family cytochrome oxidase biogenesis protein [Pseudomonadota bacterium]
MNFVLRPVLLVFATLGTLVLLSLGTWQVQRLAWKTDLIAMVEARAGQAPVPLADILAGDHAAENTEYLPVAVSGGFPSEKVAHVFGTLEGQAGYYAFQVMRLDDGSGRLVLINRGFVPQDEKAETYPLPNARVLTGLVRHYGPARGLAAAVAPPARPADGIFFDRDPAKLAAYLTPGDESSYLPFAVDSTLPTELPRGDTTRLDFRNAHLGYAITWFGLAIGLVTVTAFLSRKASA